MGRASVIAEARLRERNQLTLPDAVVRAGGLTIGDRFVVEVDPVDRATVRLHRIRTTYAGALRELFGDAAAALAEERGGWR